MDITDLLEMYDRTSNDIPKVLTDCGGYCPDFSFTKEKNGTKLFLKCDKESVNILRESLEQSVARWKTEIRQIDAKILLLEWHAKDNLEAA